MASFRPRAQAAAKLDPGQAWHHPVEHHQIGRHFLQAGIGLVAAGRGLDLVAFRLEVIAEQHGERLLVFDNQDAGAHVRSPYLSPACSAAIVVVSPLGRRSAIGRPSMT